MDTDIQTDACLQALNTMAVPAKADYLCEISSISDINNAVQFARNKKLKMFVLGDGSNTVFKDDYLGLILLNRLLGIEVLEESSEQAIVKVSAGENWHDFVNFAVTKGWFGLENLALIPGQVGAAPIQNIGAYGQEVKNSIRELEFIHFENLSLSVMRQAECQFAYRNSVFKGSLRGLGMVTSVTFCLSKKRVVNLSYPALRDYFHNQETVEPEQIFAAVCDIRGQKLPAPALIPNAGSFFKNPVIGQDKHSQLKAKYPDLVSFAVDGGVKVAAAWLIDQAGWKSKSVEQVMVHSEQALVIVNPHKQEGKAVLSLAAAIQKDINQKFDLILEIEPNIV